MRPLLAAALLALAATGCEQPDLNGGDAGAVPAVTSAQVDDKSKLYNLIGRWYPVSEVRRFRDESLTPEEWCEREPMRVNVMPDVVEVQCLNAKYSAALARVRTSSAGTVLLLRAPKDYPLRQVRFEAVNGPSAAIAGLPCFPGRSEPHQRFPEFEVLTRQVLGGRRCSQLEAPIVPVEQP